MTENKDNLNKLKRPKFNIYWVYGIIAAIFILIQFLNVGQEPTPTSWRTLEKKIKARDIEKIDIVNRERAEVYIKEEKLANEEYQEITERGFGNFTKTAPHYYLDDIGSVDSFEKKMEEAQDNFSEIDFVPVNYVTRKDYFVDIIGWLLPIVVLVGIWVFMLRRMGGGAGGGGGAGNIFSIGKSKAKVFDKEEDNIKTNFKDVAGLAEAKVEVMEIVDFLKNPEKYTQLGGKIPKGALLVGPPGTGKTLLAKAVAGEADVPFFSMAGSDFVEMFVGVGASRVRDLFGQAKAKAPCIIFIDEIDAIGRARGKNPNMGANDERENTLNQLLTEMDGFGTNAGVIILAATNRADILDRALMRAGRFDRQIHVELPDLNERNEIFAVHLKPIKVDTKLDVEFLAKQTPGFSGADIANVCNESALIAARKGKSVVEKQDFLDAVDRIIGGLEKKNKIITINEKRTIAFHEAGHAAVSWLLEHAHPLVKVTIVPRGSALGAAWYLPEERQITTKEQILDDLSATLGGRVAEELSFGKISTGAINDLEKVTKQAYAMVSYYGMSEKVGNLSFYDSSGQNEYGFSKPYSEETAVTIDREARAIIDAAYEIAREVLTKNYDGFKQLAEMLLDREVLFSEDVENIFGKRKTQDRYEKAKQENEETADSTNKADQNKTVADTSEKEAPSTNDSEASTESV